MALKSDGTVWTWGDNSFGELGNGSSGNSNVPVQVAGLNQVTAIAAGNGYASFVRDGFAVALRWDGTVWAWGSGSRGQLGNGANNDSNVPVRVSGIGGVSAIATGGDCGLALLPDGTVWSWGHNASGELGIGSNTDTNTPVQIVALRGVVALGNSTAPLALESGGILLSWGYNGFGAVGNGTTTNSSVPVPVLGLSGVIAMGSNPTGSTNFAIAGAPVVVDVQAKINEALGVAAANDLNGDGVVNAVDVQIVINAVLGLGLRG
jgi:alpha-tubulin suppressor-like RCC1 family protein